MKKELIAYQDPKSMISESFRTLRTNIQFMNTKGKLRSILVTSTMPSEGKTWVSANLAITFAQADKKVILIDADMRKGRQYSLFEVSPRPGLSNYLSEASEDEGQNNNIDLGNYIQETEIENLYVITAGNVPPNPSELLVTSQMVNLMDRLKEIFDIIIIDGTPSQLVTDALILARLADTTLIVSAVNQTKKEDLKRVITNIKQVGGKIAGIVANKVPMSVKKYGYGYYGSTEDIKKSKKSDSYSRKNIQKNENRRQNSEIYNKASNLMAQNKEKPKIEEKETEEKNTENKDNMSVEDTVKILDQINKYLDDEKKKL